MNVNRSYRHKDFGQIGTVELTVVNDFAGGVSWELDNHKLPASSVEHLMNFALQTLQDAYAGADSADEAAALWEKKRLKLIDGTIGVRTGGNGVDELTHEMRKIARAELKKNKGDWVKFVALEDNYQIEMLDTICAHEKYGPEIERRAKSRIELRREQSARINVSINL